MQVAIHQLDSHFTLQIPAVLATQIGLQDGMQVELRVMDGKLIIVPQSKEFNLERLLAEITPDNLHDEVDAGSRMGNEIW